ncbi:MAG: YfiT family bacillithiol transferase [Bacteroidota bacterium]
MTDPLYALRYPIGTFTPPDVITPEQIAAWIDDIAALPAEMRAAVEPLSEDQLDTPYRPGGWSVRQVVHHVPDSHLNAMVRFKWTLTEDHPTIKPYDENGWAGLIDYRAPIHFSLDFFETLHARWVNLLRQLTPEQLLRGFDHPESGYNRLDGVIGMYRWHGRHHLAQITSLIEREGWG